MKTSVIKKKISLRDLRPLKAKLRAKGLRTVCEEARCPNAGECFLRGVATIMILGDVCTRACKFCNVKTGRPLPPDPREPQNVADLVFEQKYKHVVITSVDRDDLTDDFGAGHFAQVIRAVRQKNPQTTIEVLTPDFQGRQDCLDTVCREAVAVFNHNIETVARLTPLVRSVARYQRSLEVISYVHKTYPHIRTKSGLMLGLGETRDEVLQSMRDLRAHGCQLLTLGQYLQPTRKHYPVMAHISQEQFTEYENLGREMGFETVFAGTFVRSSYRAGGYTKDEGRKHEGRGTRDEGTRDENTRDEGQAEWTLRQAQGRLKGREKTKIKNEKCKMQNAKCKMQNAKCQPHD